MSYETIDCIDCGTEFCPCHLAEQGECLLCSQLHGKCFCDCKNWKGICVYQEFINNKSKAKLNRGIYNVLIKERELLEENLLKLTVEGPHKLIMDLLNPGSFIFIKGDSEENYFDFPISIEEADPNNNTLSMYIEIRGIKTKKILDLYVNDILKIRGPYFNGVFGIKNINSIKNSKALIISRGIGLAPAIPVIKKLQSENNFLDIIYDFNPFKKDYFKFNNSLKVEHLNTIDKGELSDEIKDKILKSIENGIELIHCAGADILTYKVIEFLNSINREDIKLSCCNNSKMCCGEGVCGSCTVRFAGHTVKRLCKVQADPRNIFEGRRFI